jgi:threonine synthase
VVVARALEIGAQTVITASTGNAGAALAGMAAAVDVPAVILAPATAPQAKIAQLLIYGAQVVLVDGNYDQAFELSLEAAEEFGWYCRNTGYNPFTAEGKKTAAFEICEQLSDPGVEQWRAPEAVIVSVGDGNIITGLHKGFKDLLELGWIDHLPRLYGIQSTGSAAVTNAFEAEAEEIQPVQSDTLADSISVDLPRDGLRALRAVRETGGAMIAVDDKVILESIRLLGREAIFAEPAGATAYAGLEAAVEKNLVAPDERIVVVITGSGLKDVPAAMRAAGEATVIEPTLDALRELVD